MNRYLTVCSLIACLFAPAALAQDVPWLPGPGVVAYEDRAYGDTYIVLHQSKPVATYAGGIAGLLPTTPDALGLDRLDVSLPAVTAYLAFLPEQHDQLIAAAEQALGRPIEVTHRMQHALSGFTAKLSPDEARVIAGLPGVKRVEAGILLDMQSDNGPDWINAPSAYDGSGTFDGVGSRGAGVVIGVIDSGVNQDHPSFAAVGPVDGHVHQNPLLSPITGLPQYLGLCDPLTGAPFCNDKLIGVWDFTGTLPTDDDGHGSHTASTAGGNVVDAVLNAPTTTLERRISGVAPHANIITYKGCMTSPLLAACLSPSTALAINQAVRDGVDVLNFSIGGPSGDPWSDANAQAFLAAREAGVFVATSGGNSGPAPATLGSPADAPWLLSVAASTHDRALGNALIDLTGGASTPPADIDGRSLTAALPAAPILYAGDFGDPLCEMPFAAGTFSGEIVVCDRGNNARVEKADNVAAGGAGGFVLANDEPNGASLSGDAFAVPGVHISFADGVALKAWLADGGTGHSGAIRGSEALQVPALGDVTAGFSSRGPNPAAPGIVKPDITAPGVDVVAAVLSQPLALGGSEPEFGVLSGTSMSSPHAAGAAALLRALQPDWTPDEIQSALMTTAFVTRGRATGVGLVKDDGITPADAHDVGAGRIDLSQAAKAGFVLDETAANYDAANPANGGDPTTLNRPSLGNGNCEVRCAWTRTLTGTVDTQWITSVVSADGLTVSVTPDTFSLGAGEQIELQFEADVTGQVPQQWAFADVLFTPSSASIPESHLPVAVFAIPAEGDIVDPADPPVAVPATPSGGSGGAFGLMSLLALLGGLLLRRRV